jgi:hypothetical protein
MVLGRSFLTLIARKAGDDAEEGGTSQNGKPSLVPGFHRVELQPQGRSD